MRRALAVVLLLLLTLIVVVTVRALTVRSRQIAVEPATTPAVNASQVAEHLAQAVRYATLSYDDGRAADGDAFEGLRRYLEQTYPLTHRRLSREIISGYSLLYTWRGMDASLAPILLAAHMDVVPADPATLNQWTKPPFDGAVAEGFVYGRGTLDDKVAVIGILEAVEMLLASGAQPRRTVYLAFGHDEEAAGRQGAAKIAELLGSRGVKLEYALDEGGFVTNGIVPGVDAPAALIAVAEKGFLNLELKVSGTGGHSSAPPSHTAAGILATAVHNIEANPMPAGLRRPQSDLFDYLAPEMKFGMRAALANLWLFRPVLLRILTGSPLTNAVTRTTTAVTMLEASPKSNVLPTEARAVVNFRLLPGDHAQDVVEHVRKAVGDMRVALRILESNEASAVSDIGSGLGSAIQKTAREVFAGSVAAPSLMIGASDGRYYAPIAANVYRFLPVNAGPDIGARLHGINERVAIGDLERTVRFYARLIAATTVN